MKTVGDSAVTLFKKPGRSAKRRGVHLAAMVTTLGLVTGCAGGVSSSGSSESGGDGVELGATKEDYTEALADMDPVTLTFQDTASSAEDIAAYRSNQFKESVEELSDGKITIEMAYGPSISPYNEVDSALSDGRIDIAYMIPIYQPGEYPTFTALAAAGGLMGSSPMSEELVVNAAMLEVAYDSESLFEQYEARGVTPLIPLNATSSVMAMCSQPVESLDDWAGNIVSIGSSSTLSQVQELGGTATSLEYTETYEALQRNTVDCSLSTTLAATMTGLSEVAPNVSYSSSAGFGRGAGAVVAGTGYEQLPLAAKQLIYDQMGDAFKNSRRADLQGTNLLMQSLDETGGSVNELDDDASERLSQSTQKLLDDSIDEGSIDADIVERVEASEERWRPIVEELGYVDEGDFTSFPKWHDNDPDALKAYADRVFEELIAEHRPS